MAFSFQQVGPCLESGVGEREGVTHEKRIHAWFAFGSRCLRGLPVLAHEVSRRAWGLRLRQTEQELALSLLFVLPSEHFKAVGVQIYSFVGSRSGAVFLRSRLPGAPRFLWGWDRAR